MAQARLLVRALTAGDRTDTDLQIPLIQVLNQGFLLGCMEYHPSLICRYDGNGSMLGRKRGWLHRN